MKAAAVLFHTIVRATGPVLVVLGVLFWTGHAYSLLALHMVLGVALVLALLALAILGALARVPLGFVALAIVWSFLVPALGVTQAQLLPGAAHWVVRLLHLVVGIAALGLAEQLAQRIKRGGASGVPSSRPV